jgi:hypothetical protein
MGRRAAQDEGTQKPLEPAQEQTEVVAGEMSSPSVRSLSWQTIPWSVPPSILARADEVRVTAPIGAKCLEGLADMALQGQQHQLDRPGLVGRFAPTPDLGETAVGLACKVLSDIRHAGLILLTGSVRFRAARVTSAAANAAVR